MQFIIQISMFLCCMFLTGCAQYEAQQQANAAAEAQYASSQDDARCQSYGAPVGSPGYIQCRMNLDNQAAADMQQRRALAFEMLRR